ncbi:MAG: DUF5615 family PIN-like protein [Candidatus Vogelbacteria bacterium]|nr:DUF5615 family PIN-like protein [Candidatus Vogelbacteria bacterium]
MEVVNLLRRRRHSVRSVLEEKSLRGSDDNFLLNLAAHEKRIVITLDKDFGSLVFRFAKKSSGIILLRLRNERADNALTVMNQLLESKLKLAGRFTVVSEDQVKSREI